MITNAIARAREIAQGFRMAASGSPLLSAAKKSDEGELFIYAPIGDAWWGDGVTAQQVADKLAELKGVAKLTVRINSEGGDIWEGKAIHNAIARFDTKEKVCHVDGLCASAATHIAMACPRIVTAANGTWMIHEVHSIAAGTADDLRATAAVIDKENDTFAAAYAKRTGLSAKDCRQMMADETWMNAEEAKAKGFTDEIEGEEAETEEDPPAAACAPILALQAQTRALLAASADRERRARLVSLSHEVKPGQPGTARPAVRSNATK